MLSKMPLNYQRSSFTLRNCGCALSLYGCSLRASSPFGEVAKSHPKEDTSVRGGEREEEFSSSHSIGLPISFSPVVLKVKQKFMTGQPGARVSSSYSSFSLPLGLFATSFCVPSSWILSVAINGELAGRLMYGCKHKSNLGQPSSEDPHTVSINSKTFYFTKVFIKAFGA